MRRRSSARSRHATRTPLRPQGLRLEWLEDRVVPADEVYSAARELVARYVTGPTLALRAAKLAVDGGLSMDLAAGLAWESQLFASLLGTLNDDLQR